MTKPIVKIVVAGWVLMAFAGARVWAEETPAAAGVPAETKTFFPDAGADEGPEPEYAFGTVKAINGQELTLTEFDYDTNKEREVTYTIDATAELNNVTSVAEIIVGDEVDVDYFVREGKNVAVVVAVAKPLNELEGLGE
jgi:hypothetical protein